MLCTTAPDPRCGASRKRTMNAEPASSPAWRRTRPSSSQPAPAGCGEPMTDLVALAKRNSERWVAARLTRGPEFSGVALRLVAPAAKARYQAVEARTGVPWYFTAVTHEREASQRWNTQLGQGDPLNEVSTHVPAGRGPFKTWEDGAVDALVKCPPYAAKNKDWSIGGLLTMLEQYNGTGYANGPAPWRGPNAGRKFPPQ